MEAERQRIRVTVEPSDGNHEQYLVVAVATLVATLATIQCLSDQFDDLAEEPGGNYDGWGAEAVE